MIRKLVADFMAQDRAERAAAKEKSRISTEMGKALGLKKGQGKIFFADGCRIEVHVNDYSRDGSLVHVGVEKMPTLSEIEAGTA